MQIQGFTRLCILATILAITVSVFGSFVRLSHAGLSCPDWPGCYGQIVVPQDPTEIAQANSSFPQRPVDAPRAWKEMGHRYLAGALGLLIVGLAALAWRRRYQPGQRIVLPFLLVLLVVAQAALGMWTVTLLLKPIIVTAHLLGGLTTTALLWWMSLRHGGLFTGYARPLSDHDGARLGPWVLLGIAVLYVQLFLGGWVSTNYAALACADFPLCQGGLLPALDFKNALTPWHQLGIDYEGGILETKARVTIHLMHRLGALVVFLYLGALSLTMMRHNRDRRLKTVGIVLLFVLIAQIALGIANVLFSLPLPVAVAHNAGAVALLMTLVLTYHVIRPAPIVI
ncbi:MAG: cytochrome c oxidase assembly protein subunit 15 [Gammaproteobacteria bacterium]|jgi:cytochrome c oxidase assembly protein subunit 15